MTPKVWFPSSPLRCHGPGGGGAGEGEDGLGPLQGLQGLEQVAAVHRHLEGAPLHLGGEGLLPFPVVPLGAQTEEALLQAEVHPLYLGVF